MQTDAIVLSSLLLLTCTQVLLNTAKSNLQTQQLQPVSSLQDQAVDYIYEHYTQLAYLSFASVLTFERRANDTSKAASRLVVLGDNQTTQATAIVSFSQDGQILEASPLLLRLQPSNTSAAPVLSYNSSSGRQIAYLQSGNQLAFLHSEEIISSRIFPANSIPLATPRLSDSRLSLALALILACHPQMAHYSVESVSYQLVSGINYFIRYRGKDEITQVKAWVFIDLDLKARLIELQVGCLEALSTPFNCSSQLAGGIFKVGESLILIYPQLAYFNLQSVLSDDTGPEDGMLFILTYERWDGRTRTMVELNLTTSGFVIQSYYVYSSPKS